MVDVVTDQSGFSLYFAVGRNHQNKKRMTKRDFLILVIKLFGLNAAVVSIFSVLPNNVLFSLDHVDDFVIIWIIISAVVVAGLFWLLTFKADKLVDLLRLDKGFSNDRIELGNINPADIIKVGVFIIGGLMIVRHIPILLSQIFWAFKGDIVGQEFTPKDKFNLGTSGLNVLLGYLLFTNYDVIAKRLKRKEDDA